MKAGVSRAGNWLPTHVKIEKYLNFKYPSTQWKMVSRAYWPLLGRHFPMVQAREAVEMKRRAKIREILVGKNSKERSE